jgi:hypothetical protein
MLSIIPVMGERKAGQAIEVFLFLQRLAINGVVSFGRENMRKVTTADLAVSSAALPLPSRVRDTEAIDRKPSGSTSNRETQIDGAAGGKDYDGRIWTTSDEILKEANTARTTRTRKKSEPVESACFQCRKRKTKCTGQRPACRYCRDCNFDCIWEASEGLTRTEDLRQQLQSVVTNLKNLEAMVGKKRNGTDEEATIVLARLRLGAPIEEMVRVISTESMHREYSNGK